MPTPLIDTTVSHSARIWDYWLGGRDNYAVDRELGDQIAAGLPDIVVQARADRLFLGRAVTFAARELGIRQFLDVGTGLPTADNTHEVAQRVAPESKIVYVDNDPLVLVHARALLTSAPEGVTDYLDADMYDPQAILDGASRTLDFTEPVCLTMLGVLWHVLDDDIAKNIIDTLLAPFPSGSVLAVAHPTLEVTGDRMAEAIRQWNEFGKPSGRSRTPEELAALFGGLELAEPGLVSCPLWRPDPSPFGTPAAIDQFCGVGVKP
ncbi:SAM-dependent methyltransferase [Actinocorallia lasiicapitis]